MIGMGGNLNITSKKYEIVYPSVNFSKTKRIVDQIILRVDGIDKIIQFTENHILVMTKEI